MRILGFSKKWNKLKQPEFTTFRFKRLDRDWEVGEYVQVVYKPRSKDREILGCAKIFGKERRWIALRFEDPSVLCITEEEARKDGFETRIEMITWLQQKHGFKEGPIAMNMLVLRWCDDHSNTGTD